MGKRKEQDVDEYFKKKLKKLSKKIDKMRESRRRNGGENDADAGSKTSEVQQLNDNVNDNEAIIIPDGEIIELEPQVQEGHEHEREVLQLLGDTGSVNSDNGPDFDIYISERWTPILIKGLDKSLKKELADSYVTPANCLSLESPLLNPEVVAAAAETNLFRDNMLLAKQKQLAKGITALGLGLSKVINNVSDQNLEVVKHLSNAGRILCDLYQTETTSRKNLMLTSLSKDMKDAVKDVPADKWLFGDNLTDRIKNQKAISKSATEIKRKPMQPPVNKKPMNNGNQKNNLNWKGPFKPRAATMNPYRSQQQSSGPHQPFPQQFPPQQRYRQHYTQPRQAYKNVAQKRRY